MHPGLRNDPDAPRVPKSFRDKLRAISPHLRIVWKRYRFDPKTGRYWIIERGPEIGRPVPWPGGGGRWCVMVANDAGVHFLFAHMDEEGGFLPLDDRLIERLLLDAARCATPSEIASLLEDSRLRRTARLRKRLDELQTENFKRNRGKIREVMDGGLARVEWHCQACGCDDPPVGSRIVSAAGMPRPTPVCRRCGSNRLTNMPTRDPKIVSFPGQRSRVTRLGTVEKSAEEAGWDLVDVNKEMERAG